MRFNDVIAEQKAKLAPLLERGRYYRAIKRPKGFGIRKARQCYYNAQCLTIEGRGRYIEGIVYCQIRKDSWLGIPHAWITRDGETAIDVTLKDAEQHIYFGIEFSAKEVAALCLNDARESQSLLNGSIGFVMWTPPNFPALPLFSQRG